MMTATHRIESFAAGDRQAAAFASLAVPSSGPDEPVAPGTPCLLAWDGTEPVARLSFSLADGLHGAPGHSGIIGHYEALDAGAGVALLGHACQALRAAGALRVVGPMNGSTWRRYRLVLPTAADEEAVEPPFPGEPRNPPEYPAHFEAAGFSVAARYESAITRDLAEAHPRAAEIEEALRARGIRVRALDPARFAEELAAIFTLSLRAFARNLFYSPITLGRFRAIYERVRPLLDPELVRLAYDASGRLVGYVFAYPDAASQQALTPRSPLPPAGEGEPYGRRLVVQHAGSRETSIAHPPAAARVVLKTLATEPEMRGLGLGAYLTDEVRRVAHQKGYAAVIHALMQVGNDSRRISRHTAQVFRRYALFQWTP